MIIYMHILRKTYCFSFVFNFMKGEYNLVKHVCENCSIIKGMGNTAVSINDPKTNEPRHEKIMTGPTQT